MFYQATLNNPIPTQTLPKPDTCSVKSTKKAVSLGTCSNTYPPKFFYGFNYSMKIDYLQYTMDNPPDEALFSEEINSINMYKRGFRAENGARYYIGNPNSERWLCILSGQAMDNLRQVIPEKDHLEMILKDGSNISRLDIAMDIVRDGGEGTFIDVDTVIKFFAGNKITSKHVDYGAKLISGVEDGILKAETFYIGDMKKRASRGIVRAYDKGFEMDLSRYMHTRIEVEEKRKFAQRTAKQIVKNDLIGTFRAKFDVDNPLWQSLFDTPPIEPIRGKSIEKDEDEEQLKRWAWLVEQVAPSLGKAIAGDALKGQKNNFELFNEAVEKAYNAEIKKAIK